MYGKEDDSEPIQQSGGFRSGIRKVIRRKVPVGVDPNTAPTHNSAISQRSASETNSRPNGQVEPTPEPVIKNNEVNRESVIRKILNPTPSLIRGSLDDTDKLSFMQGKTMKLAILVFFFMIFRSILYKIYDFFDVDAVFSNTMTAWLGVVILLWVALPSKLSVLKRSQMEKDILAQKQTGMAKLQFITGLFISLALMTVLF